ncbi:hypothetical protein C408_1512 [Vibrio diabolicus E0666]|nr:hypothetical protein C408_1512 [Vibrio diabolicus E0666]
MFAGFLPSSVSTFSLAKLKRDFALFPHHGVSLLSEQGETT